jgi:hypothetical protein
MDAEKPGSRRAFMGKRRLVFFASNQQLLLTDAGAPLLPSAGSVVIWQ